MNSLDGLRPSVDLEYVLEAETFQKGRRFSRVWFLDGQEERQNVVKRIVRLSPDTTQDYFCQEETMVLKVSGCMTHVIFLYVASLVWHNECVNKYIMILIK